MEFFARHDLETLLRDGSPPAVSIYLPQDGNGPDPERDRLRFRSALSRARELLAADDRYRDAGDLLEPLEPLAHTQAPWAGCGSVGVFHSPGVSRRYRLPAEVPDLVVVAPSFHTRPLLDYLQTPERFWILELGQGLVRLWSGDARGVQLVEPSPLPADMEDALGYGFARDPEVVHRAKESGPPGDRVQKGGAVGAFHGHGVGVDDREPELRVFFREVDDALRKVLDDAREPVILAAVEEHHPLYRSISRIDTLVPEGIVGSIRDWPRDRIHAEAWPIAVKAVDERIARALELWEASYGRGKGEMDPANLGRLAVAGRIRALLTERGRHLWGTLDRETGALTVVGEGDEDPGPEYVDLLDELSELVLLHGGSTLVVPAERMPTPTGIAGILR